MVTRIITSIHLACLACAPNLLAAPGEPPPNDNFADRILLPSQPSLRATMDMRNATRERSDWGFNPGVWWSWHPPQTGYYQLSTINRDARLTIGNALTSPVGVLEERWIRFDTTQAYNFHLEFPPRSDRVDFHNSTAGFTIQAAPPLLNDSFNSPLPLQNRMTCHNVGATSEANEPSHGGLRPDHSVWYSWTAPDTGHYVLNGYGAVRMGVYTGDRLDSLETVVLGTRTVTFSADAGEEFRIAFTARTYTGFTLSMYGYRASSIKSPSNDDFENAALIEAIPTTITSTLLHSTLQEGEPAHGRSSRIDGSLWWRWTPQETSPITLATPDSASILAVYTGHTLENLNELVAGPRVHFLAKAHTTYLVAVANERGGPFTLTLDDTPRGPRNDHFSNADPIELGQRIKGSFVGASLQEHKSFPGSACYLSVWYRWNCLKGGLYRLDDTGAQCAEVWTGSALGQLRIRASNRLSNSVQWVGEAGETYHIVLASASEAVPYQIHLEELTRPINDDFANRHRLESTSGIVITGMPEHSSREPGERHHGRAFSAEGSLWWSWTAPHSGPVSIDLRSNDSSVPMGIYTGDTLAELSQVTEGNKEIHTFTAQEGTTYQIAIATMDSEDAIPVRFSIHVTPPPNDHFASRLTLNSTLPVTDSALMFHSTTESGEPFEAPNSVWWEWTSPYSGWVEFDVHGSEVPTSGRILEGANLRALETIALTTNTRFLAAKGTTYFISLSGINGRSSFTLRESRPVAPNDSFEEALVLHGESVTTSFHNWLATTQPGEPDSLSHSLWWAWTAPRSGWVTGIEHLFAGEAVDSLTKIAPFNEDLPKRFPVVEGQRYHIAISSPGFISSQFTLSMDPPGDLFANAIVLPPAGGFTSFSGTVKNATWENREPYHTSSPSQSVWFRWIAPETGTYTIRTEGAVNYSIYLGDDLTTLSPITDVRSRWEFEKGVEYRIVVNKPFNSSSASDSFTLFINRYFGAYHEWRHKRRWDQYYPDSWPESDPDLDGRSNLMEMALGSDPLRTNRPIYPVKTNIDAEGITLSVVRPNRIEGVRYSFDIGSTLNGGEWSNSSTLPHQSWSTDRGDGTETFSVKLTSYSLETHPKLFARLRVELVSPHEGDE